MRIKDSNNLYSNWSDFASLTLSEVRVVTSFVEITTVSEITISGEIPSYVSAIIGLAAAAIVVGLLAALVLAYCKLRRKKKQQKLRRSVRCG